MFRLWCKIIDKSNKTLAETVLSDERDTNRTAKVLDSLAEACRELDLAVPIWLDSNINEFKTYSKTRFLQDNFAESVDFHALEIQVIEE